MTVNDLKTEMKRAAEHFGGTWENRGGCVRLGEMCVMEAIKRMQQGAEYVGWFSGPGVMDIVAAADDRVDIEPLGAEYRNAMMEVIGE